MPLKSESKQDSEIATSGYFILNNRLGFAIGAGTEFMPKPG